MNCACGLVCGLWWLGDHWAVAGRAALQVLWVGSWCGVSWCRLGAPWVGAHMAYSSPLECPTPTPLGMAGGPAPQAASLNSGAMPRSSLLEQKKQRRAFFVPGVPGCSRSRKSKTQHRRLISLLRRMAERKLVVDLLFCSSPPPQDQAQDQAGDGVRRVGGAHPRLDQVGHAGGWCIRSLVMS